MADNVAITAGAGTDIATDLISSVHYQRVKIVTGPDGTANDASTATPVPVSGHIVRVDTEFTRPSPTTNYSSGDVVSDSTSSTTLITLASVVRFNGGTGYIVRVSVSTDKKSITPQLRVYFYNASNPTVAVDNVAHKELYADIAKSLGFVDLPAMTTAQDASNSTMSVAANSTIRLPIVAGGSTRDIYALLVTLNNFAPANAQKFTLSVCVDNN